METIYYNGRIITMAEAEPMAIRNIQVLKTIKDGKCVYSK